LQVSERTVARDLQRLRPPGGPAQPWLAFLVNHREAIVACAFFTVSTLTFQLLYGFFAIEHSEANPGEMLHRSVVVTDVKQFAANLFIQRNPV
jgi:hypothetical protein